MEFAIEAINLRKSFQGNEVVKGINLRVKKGELFAILGPNGAGKTTTINMLTTLLNQDGGTAKVAGFDIQQQVNEVRKRISLTGQFAALDEGLTGIQNLEMVARLSGYAAREARSVSEQYLQSFGLWEAKDKIVGNYSGGMRRRLDIAASIITQPELIFLDEPTTGLDPRSRIQVWKIVRMLLDKGTTVLLTTQYLEEADQLADRIAVIHQGMVIAEGTPMELKASIGGKTLTLQLETETAPDYINKLLSKLSFTAYSDSNPLIYKIAVQEAKLANQVIHTFLENDISVNYFSLSEPSLDEVFLTLTHKSKEVV